MIQTRAYKKNFYTPLRYPGGKTSLCSFFSKVIQASGWKHVIYIEPYAGGAGAGIALLMLGLVDRIVINDLDPAIYSFWKAVTEQHEYLIDKIQTTPLTIAEWKRQKEIYTHKEVGPELGFAAFYLNRTNRSGILNAGPIGGMNQDSRWKIDARFDRESLSERIDLIATHRKDIIVQNDDGVDIIRQYAHIENAFFYIDPPYYKKGSLLYLNSFSHAKHQELADLLNSLPDLKWLLSYDAVDEIKAMYEPLGRMVETFSLRYSVHRNTKSGLELMIFSDAFDANLLD